MAIAEKEPVFELETNRIEALSDGIFAIVMTLLILEMKVPSPHGEHVALSSSLIALWPKFLCYIISFITLGVYWVAHHLHFVNIRKADRMLLWINILFLMSIGVVPFTTALIGEFVGQPLPVILYGINMIVTGLVLYLHWAYATKNRRLVDSKMDLTMISSVKVVILMGPAVYMIAIGAAFINTWISIALYLLVNLLI